MNNIKNCCFLPFCYERIYVKHTIVENDTSHLTQSQAIETPNLPI